METCFQNKSSNPYKMRALDTSVKMLMEKLDGIGATEELH